MIQALGRIVPPGSNTLAYLSGAVGNEESTFLKHCPPSPLN